MNTNITISDQTCGKGTHQIRLQCKCSITNITTDNQQIHETRLQIPSSNQLYFI